MNIGFPGESLEKLKETPNHLHTQNVFPFVPLCSLPRFHSESYLQICFTHHLKRSGESEVFPFLFLMLCPHPLSSVQSNIS